LGLFLKVSGGNEQNRKREEQFLNITQMKEIKKTLRIQLVSLDPKRRLLLFSPYVLLMRPIILKISLCSTNII